MTSSFLQPLACEPYLLGLEAGALTTLANQNDQSLVFFQKNDGPYECAFAAERMIAMATASAGSEDTIAKREN